jgi:MoaA/NifB/PqqE/SkfB family radical SAM enzyme
MSFVDGYLKYCKPSEELKRRIDQAEFAIENGDTFLSYYPLSLDFSFGYKCNGRCPMCSIGTDRSYQSLQPAREQYEFLDNLVSNCFLYRITGGEFFCLSDYEKDLCLRSVRRDVTLTSLYTNGVLLTIDNYEKYCVEGPIDKVHVSIDTVNEVAYGILRGMDLNQVKKNLADISMKYPYHKIASINCVISAFSYPGVFDFVQYAKEIGVKNVMFTQMSPYNLSKHNLGHLDVISTSMNEDTVVKFDALVSKCKEYSKKTGVMVYGLDEALQSMILNVYDK